MAEDDDAKQISAKVLVSLIRKKTETATKIGELNGDLGEKIKHHQEHSNLNRAAFAFVAKLHRMEELKREGTIDAVQLYLDVCHENLWGRERHVGDLVKEAETPADPDTAAAEANTAAVAAGIKPMRKNRGAKNGRPEAAPADGGAPASENEADLRPTYLKTGGVESGANPGSGDAAGTYTVN